MTVSFSCNSSEALASATDGLLEASPPTGPSKDTPFLSIASIVVTHRPLKCSQQSFERTPGAAGRQGELDTTTKTAMPVGPCHFEPAAPCSFRRSSRHRQRLVRHGRVATPTFRARPTRDCRRLRQVRASRPLPSWQTRRLRSRRCSCCCSSAPAASWETTPSSLSGSERTPTTAAASHDNPRSVAGRHSG